MIAYENEPMSRHTTFKIGGNALYYLIPESLDEIKEAVDFSKEKKLPYFIIGHGSNLLVSDDGFDGVIIEVGKGVDNFTIDSNGQVSAEAGVLLSVLSNAVAKEGFSGFECLSGIPGTLGGAVTMNAGAYGGEIKDVITSATVLDSEGNILTLSKEQLELGYRKSIVQKKNYIVISATFSLEKKASEDILSKMKELNEKRREKQPLEYPSAGSTFKRPEGYFAGKLIEDAGLKGYRVGGAMVSQKHSGFVINVDNATCKDVVQLIADVKDKVYEKFGVQMEPEVKFLG